jgi:hypothetical protein
MNIRNGFNLPVRAAQNIVASASLRKVYFSKDQKVKKEAKKHRRKDI